MSDTGIGTRRATVQDAAKSLGVSESAIRKRINRGTLRYEKDERDGRMYVFLEEVSDSSDTHSKDASDTVSDMVHPLVHRELLDAKDETIGEMRDRISSLERQLDARTEELRRRDIIISQLTEKLPELEAPDRRGDSQDVGDESHEKPPQSHEPPEEGYSPTETATEPHSASQEQPEVKKSWWRRLLGG